MTRRLLNLRVAMGNGGVMVSAVLGFVILGGVDGVLGRVIEATLRDDRSGLFSDGRLPVLTLGTGSPQLGSGRMPVANAVIAGLGLAQGSSPR